MERQRAVLMHALGTEAQRMADVDTKEDYDQCLARLEKLFDPAKSRILTRYELRNRVQQPGETLAQFAAVIRPLSTRAVWDIDDLSAAKQAKIADAMATDQFVFGLSSERLREKLFASDEDLNLDRALLLAEKHLAAERDAKMVGTSGASTAANTMMVNHVPRQKTGQSKGNFRHNKRTPGKQQFRCDRCGMNKYHSPNECPAKGQECRNCGRPNHFARVCRAARAPPRVGMLEEESKNQRVFHVGGNPSKFKFVTVQVNGRSFNWLLDLGAERSIISKEDAKILNAEVCPTDTVLLD